jgi:hypothetical protein
MICVAGFSLFYKPVWIQNRVKAAYGIVVHTQESQGLVSVDEPGQLSDTLACTTVSEAGLNA